MSDDKIYNIIVNNEKQFSSVRQLALFDRIETDTYHPMSTGACCRVPVFSGNSRIAPQKNKKNAELDVTIKNIYGTMTFKKCRLTQHHRDLCDWIFARHDELQIETDGDAIYRFNPYQFFKDIGWEVADMDRLRKWLDDLNSALIHVKTKKFNISTTVISEHGYDTNIISKTTKFGDGSPYFVRFSRRFMGFFENDTSIYYHRLLDDLFAVRDARLRSIIRFCISHQTPTNLAIRDILTYTDVIRAEQSKRYQNKTIKEIKEQAEILAQFGIIIDNRAILHYSKHEKVWFRNPPKI